ncbi:MAG: AAA family ATPase [Desulfovibrionaceae bacterium]|nr:AAA family ATPase [Desulfovibrionaceae bacterium]
MIKKLVVDNITVFTKATFNFSKGLNVLVGENGTGKSQILKLAYGLMQGLGRNDNLVRKFGLSASVALELMDLFENNIIDNLMQINSQSRSKIYFEDFDEKDFACELSNFANEHCRASDSEEIMPGLKNVYTSFKIGEYQGKSLFIPTKEIFSIYKGFRATLKSRELSFNKTYLDLAEALDQPPYKGETLSRIKDLYSEVEDLVETKFFLDDHGRFVFNLDGKILPASMAAEGHRKLGMLVYLLKNGSLSPASTLIWDEPEANLNPKLIRKLAQILVQLSCHLQIILATHSLFLLRELEILEDKNSVKYFGLNFKNDGSVAVSEGSSSDDIESITALDENLNQVNRYMDFTQS